MRRGLLLPAPPLLVITDRHQAGSPLPIVIRRAIAGGARWISLREKDLPAADRHALLDTLRGIARPLGCRVTVHGDIDAADRCDGVHLPAGGDPAAARRRLGPTALIGLSAHDADSVAKAGGADYVSVSPVFGTPSKPGYGPPLGPAGLAALVHISPVPVIALGGVTPTNLAACLSAGAAGAAVMGSVMRAPDPAVTVAELLGAIAGR